METRPPSPADRPRWRGGRKSRLQHSCCAKRFTVLTERREGVSKLLICQRLALTGVGMGLAPSPRWKECTECPKRPQRLRCVPPSGRPCTSPSGDRKSTRLNSSHGYISSAVFCLKT